MSALGQKRTFAAQNGMSALPPIADICSAQAHVRFVPIADVAPVPACAAVKPKVCPLSHRYWRLDRAAQRVSSREQAGGDPEFAPLDCTAESAIRLHRGMGCLAR